MLAGPRRPLPAPLAGFVGRERDLAALGNLLRESRLIALTGAGGIGKTRLAERVARAAADEFEDGVCWVDLGAVADPEQIPSAVAQSLGVRGDATRPLLDSLGDVLGPCRLLLVMDNCEHLIAGSAAVIETLLRAAPDLHVLATSRQVLGLVGETSWPVASLSLPAPDADGPGSDGGEADSQVERLLASEAGQVFVRRAQAVRPSLELTGANAAAIAEICRRLDGIPLALELAAARLSVLSAEQVLARLGDRFRLLTGGSPTLPRHQTLGALLVWSHDLLSPGVQRGRGTLRLSTADRIAPRSRGGRCRSRAAVQRLEVCSASTASRRSSRTWTRLRSIRPGTRVRR